METEKEQNNVLAGILAFPDDVHRRMPILLKMLDEDFFDGRRRVLFRILRRFYLLSRSLISLETLKSALRAKAVDDKEILEYDLLYTELSANKVDSLTFSIEVLKEMTQQNKLTEVLVDSMEILKEGKKIGKKDLVGYLDTRTHLTKELGKLDKIEGQATPDGDVNKEGDDVLKEYANSKVEKKSGLKTGILEVDAVTGGLKPGEFVLVAGYAGDCKCLTGDTFIRTADGLRRLIDLKPESEDGFCSIVVLVDGKKEVCPLWYNNGVKPVYKVTTELGSSIKATSKERVKVWNSDKFEFEWKYLDKLSTDDFIGIDLNPVDLFVENFDFDENICYLLGLLAGDGSYAKDISFSSADDEIFKWAELFIGVNFDFCSVYSDRRSNNLKTLKVSRVGDLRKFLELNGMYGQNSATKTVPKCVLNGTWKQQLSFVQGLMDTDGWVSRRGQIGYSSASEDLVDFVQSFCFSIGFSCRKFMVTTSHKDSYRLEIHRHKIATCLFRLTRKVERIHDVDGIHSNLRTIPGSCDYLKSKLKGMKLSRIFRERFPFISSVFNRGNDITFASYRKIRLYLEESGLDIFPADNYQYSKVSSVEYCGEEPTFDLHNPSSHSFVANGLIVHNTTTCINIVEHFVYKLKKNVVYATGETLRHQVRRKLICRRSRDSIYGYTSGLPYKEFELGELSPREEKVLKHVIDDMSSTNYGKCMVFQFPDRATVSYIKNRLALYATEFPIDVVVVDEARLLSSSRSRQSSWEELDEILKGLKQLAVTFNDGNGVLVISPYQVNRTAWNDAVKGDGHYKKSCMANSSEAERSADFILSLFRDPKTTNELAAKILKYRDGAEGEPFTLQIDLNSCFVGSRISSH